ncbi:hypothetical protein HK100_012951 [Physocladia obscura]|uniref:DDHD domain-containing protein n=1 Tax=Physocladia obscura TaxID=109957 RepID=A0AAD5SZD0_9FUNG|nr:hypothetical protein HK100_012951 [Physocladia obscura]
MSTATTDLAPPPIAVRWFHATDAPKYDHSPFRLASATSSTVTNASTTAAEVAAVHSTAGIITNAASLTAKTKAPTAWSAFSARDSAKIEETYQTLVTASTLNLPQPSPLVLVHEDFLFEVDVSKREIYPVYWHGPTFHVQRGTWFITPDNGTKFTPCDDNLSKQLEDGYKKFKPWLQSSPPFMNPSQSPTNSAATSLKSIEANNTITVSSAISSQIPPPPLSASPSEKPPVVYKPEQKWALFGPYMNSHVVYTEKRAGVIISDQLGSKLARAVMSQISRSTDAQTWGTKVFRGWDEVQRTMKKNASSSSSATTNNGKQRKLSTPGLDSSASLATASAESGSRGTGGSGVDLSAASNSEQQNSVTGESGSGNLSAKVSRESLNGSGDDAKEDDNIVQDRQIDHLVLVIHGVGQKMGERLENVDFAKDCSLLREAIKESSKLYFTPAASSPSNSKGTFRKPVLPNMPEHGGVQVLPVQWRQKLEFGKRREKGSSKTTSTAAVDAEEQKTLEDEIARIKEQEIHVDDITLEGVASIRYLVSDIVLDVLLYMTPKYRQEMVNHVVDEMNRIYQAYMQRNPNFNGKISIYGHSLGSVLAFDILCNQAYSTEVSVPSSFPLQQKMQSEMDLSDVIGQMDLNSSERGINGLMERTEIQYKTLDFKVDKFFAVGSPVALFLLLKGERLQARTDSENEKIENGVARPACNSVYNIFHPHDPVAYRFEPLACKPLAKEKPVPIQYNKGGLKGTITGISDFSSGIVSRGFNMFSGLFVSPNAPASTLTSSQNGAALPVGTPGSAFDQEKSSKEKILKDKANSATATATGFENVKLLNPRGRLDYVLQEVYQEGSVNEADL